jgi:hypothetical protein
MQNVDIFIVGDMNKAKLAQVIADMEASMNRELNYTAFRLEDFDYRRNLNDRFLLDMLDARKIVLRDDLNLFDKATKEPTETLVTTESVRINVSAPHPEITTEEAMRMAELG